MHPIRWSKGCLALICLWPWLGACSGSDPSPLKISTQSCAAPDAPQPCSAPVPDIAPTNSDARVDVLEIGEEAVEIIAGTLSLWLPEDEPLGCYQQLQAQLPALGLQVVSALPATSQIEVAGSLDIEGLRRAAASLKGLTCLQAILPVPALRRAACRQDAAPQRFAGDGWVSVLRAPMVWALPTCAADIRVGVLDSGIEAHPEHFRPEQVTFLGTPDPDDHGTAVASLIGSPRDEGRGSAGLAPGIRLTVADVFPQDVAEPSVIRRAMEVMSRDPTLKVINLSVANTGGAFGMGLFRIDLMRAVRILDARSVLLVTAAGNAGVRTDTLFLLPALLPEFLVPNEEQVRRQIWERTAINVSCTSSGTAAWHSGCNYGQAVDIAAPGEGIVYARGDGTLAIDSGSSYAAPLVSATAALMACRNSALTPAQIKQIMIDTSIPTNDPNLPLLNPFDALVDPRVRADDRARRAEACNGEDDDCDGIIDENDGPPLCSMGQSCVGGTCESQPGLDAGVPDDAGVVDDAGGPSDAGVPDDAGGSDDSGWADAADVSAADASVPMDGGEQPSPILGLAETVDSLSAVGDCWFTHMNRGVVTLSNGRSVMVGGQHRFCSSRTDTVRAYEKPVGANWTTTPLASLPYSATQAWQTWFCGVPGYLSVTRDNASGVHALIEFRTRGANGCGPGLGHYFSRDTSGRWASTSTMLDASSVQTAAGNASGAPYSGFTPVMTYAPSIGRLVAAAYDGAWYTTRWNVLGAETTTFSTAVPQTQTLRTISSGQIDRGAIQGVDQTFWSSGGLQVWFDKTRCAIEGRALTGNTWGAVFVIQQLNDPLCTNNASDYFGFQGTAQVVEHRGVVHVFAFLARNGQMNAHHLVRRGSTWLRSTFSPGWVNGNLLKAFVNAFGSVGVAFKQASNGAIGIYDADTQVETIVYRPPVGVDVMQLDLERTDPRLLVWEERTATERRLRTAPLNWSTAGSPTDGGVVDSGLNMDAGAGLGGYQPRSVRLDGTTVRAGPGASLGRLMWQRGGNLTAHGGALWLASGTTSCGSWWGTHTSRFSPQANGTISGLTQSCETVRGPSVNTSLASGGRLALCYLTHAPAPLDLICGPMGSSPGGFTAGPTIIQNVLGPGRTFAAGPQSYLLGVTPNYALSGVTGALELVTFGSTFGPPTRRATTHTQQRWLHIVPAGSQFLALRAPWSGTAPSAIDTINASGTPVRTDGLPVLSTSPSTEYYQIAPHRLGAAAIATVGTDLVLVVPGPMGFARHVGTCSASCRPSLVPYAGGYFVVVENMTGPDQANVDILRITDTGTVLQDHTRIYSGGLSLGAATHAATTGLWFASREPVGPNNYALSVRRIPLP